MQKTNALRILEKSGIEYKTYYKNLDKAVDGVAFAKLFNLSVDNTYKTLVTRGKSGNYYVFMIPVFNTLDLKKAALNVSEKNVEMIPSKDLLLTVGYVHGGCSPIGMKKSFTTVIQEGYESNKRIVFSGGKIGLLVEIEAKDLKRVIKVKEGGIIKDE